MNLLSGSLRRLSAWRRLARARREPATQFDKIQHLARYRFRDPSILRQALVHKSAIGGNDPRGLRSNERMEFLGDAVLNCLVTEYLYLRHPTESEGELSKVKSLVVSRKILGEVGASIDLGTYLTLGASERKSGGHKRKSIISNAFEALMGAIYLDGGLAAARRTIEPLLLARIDEFVGDERHVNHKSIILELSQGDGFGVPQYPVLSTSGPEHAKRFSVACRVGGVMLGEGQGGNKKMAEQAAAKSALTVYDGKRVRALAEREAEDELLSDRRTAHDRRNVARDSAEEDCAGAGAL
jgi:ribonuclease III